MITELLRPEPLPIRMTSIWRNGYQRLFQAHQERVALVLERQTQPEAGPDAAQRQSKQTDGVRDVNPKKVGSLVFKWAPDMTDILNPAHDICPSECDARALDDGFVSITPLRASYAQPDTLDTNVMLKL
jgi:tubulin--tyrosine ligase